MRSELRILDSEAVGGPPNTDDAAGFSAMLGGGGGGIGMGGGGIGGGGAGGGSGEDVGDARGKIGGGRFGKFVASMDRRMAHCIYWERHCMRKYAHAMTPEPTITQEDIDALEADIQNGRGGQNGGRNQNGGAAGTGGGNNQRVNQDNNATPQKKIIKRGLKDLFFRDAPDTRDIRIDELKPEYVGKYFDEFRRNGFFQDFQDEGFDGEG